MKKAKRILAGALAALILTMSLPLSALADEADVPVESPSFEVSFDVDTGQEEISEDLPTEVEATPEPTPESTTEPTQEPTPTPESTATPTPTAEPTAAPTAAPEVTATPTSTPEPSAAASPTPALPSASPTVTPTPTPSPQPVTNPIKLEHEVLTDYETGGLYLFPVPDGDEITQEYSEQHKAWDIAAVTGSAVVAAEEGTVTYVQIWDGSYDTTGMMSYGHMIQIEHPDGNTTLYAHLSEINVQQGEKVVRGQRIGRVGSTGIRRRHRRISDHLHTADDHVCGHQYQRVYVPRCSGPRPLLCRRHEQRYTRILYRCKLHQQSYHVEAVRWQIQSYARRKQRRYAYDDDLHDR